MAAPSPIAIGPVATPIEQSILLTPCDRDVCPICLVYSRIKYGLDSGENDTVERFTRELDGIIAQNVNGTIQGVITQIAIFYHSQNILTDLPEFDQPAAENHIRSHPSLTRADSRFERSHATNDIRQQFLSTGNPLFAKPYVALLALSSDDAKA